LTIIANSSVAPLRRPFESAQYLSIRDTGHFAQAGIEPSVGGVGGSQENALAERPYKAEALHRRGPWRGFKAVEMSTLEWIDWFNNRHLLEPIDNIPPAEAMANDYTKSDAFAIVAWLNPNSLWQTRDGSYR